MILNAKRPTNRIDIYDNVALLPQDYDAHITIPKANIYSPSPPPMSYRDLRSFMLSKSNSSNFVILPQQFNPSQLLKNSSNALTSESRRKSSHRKKHKRHGVDVYRSLVRTDSRCSATSERDFANDEMLILANSFIIDHMSSTPTSGFFHPQNLPNILKQRSTSNNGRIGSSHTKSSYTSSPSLHIQHLGRKQPIVPKMMHRASPIGFNYDTDRAKITPPPPSPVGTIITTATIMTTTATTTTTTTTSISTPSSKAPNRKQLHVYMPQILSR